LTQKMFWLLLGSLLLSPNAGWVIARGLGAASTGPDSRMLMPFWWLAADHQTWTGYFMAALAYHGWPLLVGLLLRTLGWPQLIWAAILSLVAVQALPVLAFIYLWGKV